MFLIFPGDQSAFAADIANNFSSSEYMYVYVCV
jgi:hypothetical protein